MKKLLSLSILILMISSVTAYGQYRDQVSSPYYYSGPVIDSKSNTIQQALSDFFSEKVRMSHSYSMSFGSVGGQYQNVNAYTNTMQFMFSDRLQGRLDVSFLHSPFGGSGLVNTDNNLGGEILIRNAELNYKLGENSFIRLQYQQLPTQYGYMGRYGSPFGYGRGYDRFGSWY